MAFFLSSFLYFLLIPWTLAGPASMGSLTPHLAQVIPTCAQGCLESFIASNFPSSSCGTFPDFSCLCVSSSASGLTIGEGGLECLFSDCPDYDLNNSIPLDVYDVCVHVPGAKPNTHSTLTATSTTVASATGGVRATPTNENNSSYNSDSVSVFPGASSAAFGTNTVIATATGSPSPFPRSASSLPHTRTTKAASSGVGLNATPTTLTSSISTSSSSTSSAPAATSSSVTVAAAAAAKPVLTKPQIAGVTVAGVGAAAIAFGLCFLIFCLRRKHSKRHSGWSFGGDKIIDSQETTPDMAAIGGGNFEHHPQPSSPPAVVAAPPLRRELRIVTPATSSDDGWNRYQRSMNPEEEIALAVHPPPPKSSNHSPIDPVTPASYRTSSQLLPDKPTYSLFPPPLRVTPRNSSAPAGLRPSVPTAPRQGNSPTYAKYSPRFPSNMDTSQAHLQPGSGRQRSLSDPFYDDFSRSPPPNVYPYVLASRPRSPGSSRPVPNQYPGAWITPNGVVRKPVPALQSPSARRLRPAPSRTQQPNLPRPYLPPPPIEQNYLAAIERSHSRQDPRRKQSNSSSKLTRFSNGSETSFEDADEDEVPAARKFLSPVAEFPALRSPPLSGITYPSIPISAAESATRTPAKRAPARPEIPTRSDSLLTKRLGEEKAREIVGRLQSTHSGSSEDVRNTAKWKILVSPGLNNLESSGSPQSARNNGRTPPTNMPPRR